MWFFHLYPIYFNSFLHFFPKLFFSVFWIAISSLIFSLSNRG